MNKSFKQILAQRVHEKLKVYMGSRMDGIVTLSMIDTIKQVVIEVNKEFGYNEEISEKQIDEWLLGIGY